MPYPHTYLTLTPEESQRIKTELQRLAALKKWNKRKPLQTLYLSNEKKPLKDIANYLDVPYSTVRRWVARYRNEGLSVFLPVVNQ
ncbi:MAG: helix-turn-helix domain-containing protein [Planctomycetota bacterium]